MGCKFEGRAIHCPECARVFCEPVARLEVVGLLENKRFAFRSLSRTSQHIKPGNLMPKMALHSDELVAILHYLSFSCGNRDFSH
jgi:hypothetical protein